MLYLNIIQQTGHENIQTYQLPICEGLLVNNESKYNLRHQLQHKVIVNTNRFKDFVTFRYAHSIVN